LKKTIILIVILFIITGCTTEELLPNKEKYANYLSDREYYYALYVVVSDPDDGISSELLKENGITVVKSMQEEIIPKGQSPLFEEIEEIPYYIVFDTKYKVFETNSREELLAYLKEKSTSNDN
jgi:hypothetical protein